MHSLFISCAFRKEKVAIQFSYVSGLLGPQIVHAFHVFLVYRSVVYLYAQVC